MALLDSRRVTVVWFAVVVGIVIIIFGVYLFTQKDGSAPAHKPLPEQVQLLLGAGDLPGAVALCPQAKASERGELAGMLVQWASERTPATQAEAGELAEAYLAAAELDPRCNDVYPRLVELVFYFRLLGPARQGSTLWMAALSADPARCDHPEFAVGSELVRLADFYAATDFADRNRTDLAANIEAARQCFLNGDPEGTIIYISRARELAPHEPAVLSVLADLGMLNTVSAETVVDVPLPLRADGFKAVRGGKAVVTGYVDDVPVTFVITLPGGKVAARIDNATAVSVSPDGRYAAYATEADLDEPCQVFVLRLGASGARLLLDTLGTVKETEWSPDGLRIAVSSMEGLVVVGADGSDRRVVIPATRVGDRVDWTTWAFPHWLAGGSRVAAQKLGWEWTGEVRVYDFETGTTSIALRVSEGRYEFGAVRWAPAGDRMSFCHREYTSGDNWSAAIADVGGDAATATILVSGRIDVEPVAWSPDGRDLLIRIGGHLWLRGLDSDELELLARDPCMFAVWGDDGVVYFLDGTRERLVGVRVAGERRR